MAIYSFIRQNYSYSKISNNRATRLLIFEKKYCLHDLIVSFSEKCPGYMYIMDHIFISLLTFYYFPALIYWKK